MKFYCLGYYDEKKWATMSEKDRNAFIDECFAYDDELRKGGHAPGGDGLQSAQQAKTLYWRDGKAVIVQGPYAKTKEQLGGILIIEARDLNQAVELLSKHPGLKGGPFELREVEDMSAMIEESRRRRGKAA